MALINCPECNSKLSEYADLCLKCGLPRQKFAMVQAEKARLKMAKSLDPSIDGLNVSVKATATLCPECGTRTAFLSAKIGSKCPECDLPVPGHEAFWENHTESKRLAEEQLDKWESSQTDKS